MLHDRTIYILVPSLNEVIEAFQALTYPDVAIELSLLLWLILLALPLAGIDRRETVAGFAYMTFMGLAGAAIVFAAPRRMRDVHDLAVHAVVITLLMVAAGARWSIRKGKKVTNP